MPEIDDLFALFSEPSAIIGTHEMTRDIDSLLKVPRHRIHAFDRLGWNMVCLKPTTCFLFSKPSAITGTH